MKSSSYNKIIDFLIVILKLWQSILRAIHDFFSFLYNGIAKLFGLKYKFYKYDEEMPPKKQKISGTMGTDKLNQQIELLKSQVLHFKDQSNRNFRRYKRVKAESSKVFEENKLLSEKLEKLKKSSTSSSSSNSSNTSKRSDKEVLRLADNYSQEELVNVYRRLRMKYHPDTQSHMSQAYILESTDEFVRINKAYEHLKDD